MIKFFLNSFGLILTRADRVREELSCTYETAIWYDKLQPIFSVKIEDTCDFFSFGFAYGGHHPYVRTLIQYKKNNKQLIYEESYLKKYYTKFCPSDTYEVFFSSTKILNQSHEGLTGFLLPWNNKPKIDYKNKKLMYSGPMSDDEGKHELRRLLEVYNSIEKNGYYKRKSSSLLDSNHIQGYFLKKNDCYKFIVLHGKHRIASLSVLGKSYAPVTFDLCNPRVVDISSLDSWPQVRNKTYSREVALKMFNSFFND